MSRRDVHPATYYLVTTWNLPSLVVLILGILFIGLCSLLLQLLTKYGLLVPPVLALGYILWHWRDRFRHLLTIFLVSLGISALEWLLLPLITGHIPMIYFFFFARFVLTAPTWVGLANLIGGYFVLEVLHELRR